MYQMMVAGACTLLKLCKSFFAAHIDMDYTKSLFNRTIWAIRGVSVSSNDLPERLAEVLAQMWRMGSTQQQKTSASNAEVDDTLMLKVRCRMSMSLLFDSVWRWREDAQTKGRNIEGMLDSFLQYHETRTNAPFLFFFSSLPQEPNKSRLERGIFGVVKRRARRAHLVLHTRPPR
jgi:hypothetical protein